MSNFKPLLAFSENPDISLIKYPVLASPKLDGFRVVMHEGQGLTRSLKPLPNKATRLWLEQNVPAGLDGELLVRNGTFNDCQSKFMKHDGEPDFEYHVFDFFPTKNYHDPFSQRYSALERYIETLITTQSTEILNRIKLVPHVLITSAEELVEYEEWCVAQGYEGAMIRGMNGKYKHGRSTLNEGILYKLKRWEDAEGEIISLEEQMENTNEKTTNELGQSERSSHKAGMVPKGTLGFFWIRNLKTGVEHKVGTGKGMTQKMRQEIWDDKDSYVGKILCYKFQPHGTKDKPRLPVWKGFRHIEDMGE